MPRTLQRRKHSDRLDVTSRSSTCWSQAPGRLGGRQWQQGIREQGAAQVLKEEARRSASTRACCSGPPVPVSSAPSQTLPLSCPARHRGWGLAARSRAWGPVWRENSKHPVGTLVQVQSDPVPGLTWAAARTFWYKLFPWRGSGGPAKTTRQRKPKRGWAESGHC